jgi:hypothetical protein
VGGFRSVGRERIDMPADRFHLPAKCLGQLRIASKHPQLVHEARHDVTAQSQPRRYVPVLLALEPGTLEEWLVRESVCG